MGQCEHCGGGCRNDRTVCFDCSRDAAASDGTAATAQPAYPRYAVVMAAGTVGDAIGVGVAVADADCYYDDPVTHEGHAYTPPREDS